MATIRPARWADLDATRKVFAQAFWDEEGIGHYFHPRRNEFPKDVHNFWRTWLRQDWSDWQNCIIVAETEQKKIVGAAIWTRMGTKAQVLGTWDPRRLLKYVFFIYNAFLSLIWPNRAASRTHMHNYAKSVPFWFHHFSQGQAAQNLTLKSLAVLPEEQGKGYGKSLVQWGLDQALEGDYAAAVITADLNEPFYRKCGFDFKAGDITSGDGNPLAGELSGSILFRLPRRGGP